jgi:hypothetical protein
MCCFLSSRAYNTYDRVSVGTTTFAMDPPILGTPRPSGWARELLGRRLTNGRMPSIAMDIATGGELSLDRPLFNNMNKIIGGIVQPTRQCQRSIYALGSSHVTSLICQESDVSSRYGEAATAVMDELDTSPGVVRDTRARFARMTL